MKEIKVKFLMGPPECNDANIPDYCNNFLLELSAEMNEKIVCAEIDEISKQSLSIYFIGSGGSERGFENTYTQLKEPYILLTTPAYNSLAASMEILEFLQERNLRGEILHGSISTIAERLKILERVANAKEILSNARLGCIGEPGGLIASNADPEIVKNVLGLKMVMLDLLELVDEYNKGGYEENEYTQALKQKNYDTEEVEKALNVYGAVKRLIKKYDLQAVTVKCFDLLELIHTTGCLALAILNAEGIPAGCEGDQKGLISMVVLSSLTGQSTFMANPCCMNPDKSEIIFAHCTLPLDMPDQYKLVTHFESGIGVAVTSDIKPQAMTIFKCDDSLERYYVGKAELLESLHRSDLCRSQMNLRIPEGTEYFLKNPIGNHHIICKGNWKNVIDEFFKQMVIQ